MEAEKAIVSLKRLITDLESAKNLRIWITSAESILKRIYSDRIINLDSGLTIYFNDDSTQINKEELKQTLIGYIKELEELGQPKVQEKGIGQQININQSVNIYFIIESLKEELKGKEIKELKEAYNNGKTSQEKRSNVAEKLKSFGGDLATNVLASIITNPAIISGL